MLFAFSLCVLSPWTPVCRQAGVSGSQPVAVLIKIHACHQKVIQHNNLVQIGKNE